VDGGVQQFFTDSPLEGGNDALDAFVRAVAIVDVPTIEIIDGMVSMG
jgi:hypothetical protein